MPGRKVEIFSAGCPLCEATILLVQRVACAPSEITVLDVRNASVAARARVLGVKSFPAVVVDGKLVAFDLFASFVRAFRNSDWQTFEE